MLHFRRLAATRQAPVARLASTLVSKFEAAVESLPLKEAVKYKSLDIRIPDYKWTARDFDTHINNHANALLDLEFKKTDTLAVWLPDGADKHVILMAAAKAGIKVADIDLELTDIADIRAWLAATECKSLYFDLEIGSHDTMTLLRKAIPEFFHYDDEYGQVFYSKHFPKLRYFIHMGQEKECGALNYRELFLSDPSKDLLGAAAQRNTDDDALYQQVKKGKNGIEVGPAVPASKLLDHPSWYFAKKVVAHEYFTV